MKDVVPKAKPKLAIVSTFNDLCGIAGYTRALTTYLAEDFDLEVFDLDQYLLRALGGNLLRLGDEQIEQFCARFAEFDVVNIQLEYGTLGAKEAVILKRLAKIVEAAPALSVTFHTILPPVSPPKDRLRRAMFRFELWNTYTVWRDYRTAKRFRSEVYALLRKAQKTKPVSAIVHTARDARELRLAERLNAVYDHPLSFLTRERAQNLKAKSARADFPAIARIGDDSQIIGVFGFVSEYKGIHTAIRAMSFLPNNYHLAIFGGLHPGEIRRPEPGCAPDIHPYLARLLGESHVDETYVQALGAENATLTLGGASAASGDQNAWRSPRDLSKRVHFMGVPDDDELASAMGMVDVAVLPYFEVGQASSGPMSIANEMGARIVASRNHAFMQFARYFPNRIAFFDAGNHLELAQRIQSVLAQPNTSGVPRYDADTNRAVYVAAHQHLLQEQVDA